MCFTLRIEIFLLSLLSKKNDETLPIINKSKHLKKGGKYKEQKGRTHHVQEDNRTIKEGELQREEHQVLKPPPLAISISNKERGDPFEMGGPFERTSSLKKFSPIAIACLKIEIAYTCCNVIDILCL